MSYLAEQNVIGSLLLDQSCIEQIYGLIEAEMFTSSLLGKVYMEFQIGYDNHYDVNLVVLLQKVSGDEYPEHIVSEELKKCITDTVTSAQVKSYAEAVRNEYRVRKVNSILNTTKITPTNIDDQLGALIQKLEDLLEGRKSSSKTLAQIARENKGNYFKEREVERLEIGIDSVDGMLGGLEGGDTIVIGARPGVGKSALTAQIAAYMEKHGKNVGYYNLEMQEKQMYERFIVAKSGIGLTRLRMAVCFLGDEQERFDKANEELEKCENLVITTGSKKPSEIKSECRHMGYDVIMIDYLQLMKSDKDYKGNRYAEVGNISRSIKEIAMELKIPVIILSQLNRISEGKADKKPSMSELRETGDIEQDASVIILLWNKDDHDETRKGCVVEKNRQGKKGEVELRFDGDRMRFLDLNDSTWNDASVEETPFD